MKDSAHRILLFLVLCPLLCFVRAEALEPPMISAESFILMDAASGRVLLEKDAYTKRSIASTTKLMTAYTALQSASPSGTARVKREHLKEGSSMYLAAEEELTLEALLYGLMLPSGNDAAECIADHCSDGRSDFIARMNKAAEELGMERTSFQNPSGLDEDDHCSCAYDMALLARRAWEEPDLLRLVSTQWAQVGERRMENHNKLLAALDGCVGFKTGYTSAAGRTLVSGCERDGMKLVAVTLKDRDDWADHRALYEYGFSAFEQQTILRRGEVVARLPLRGSALGSIRVAAEKTLQLPLAKGEEWKVDFSLPTELFAPLEKGDTVGEAVVTVGGEEVLRTALLCAENAPAQSAAERGIWTRLMDAIFG